MKKIFGFKQYLTKKMKQNWWFVLESSRHADHKSYGHHLPLGLRMVNLVNFQDYIILPSPLHNLSHSQKNLVKKKKKKKKKKI